MNNIRRFKRLDRVVPGLIVGSCVVLLMKLHAWLPLERTATNYLIQWRGARAWDNRIVMISIDDDTLKQLGQFPISRSYYADLVARLTADGASVIVFNMLFSDPVVASSDLEASRAANASFARSMSLQSKVVLAKVWDATGEVIQPIPVLSETAAATGHIRQLIDPDGMTRYIEVTWQGISALGVAAVQIYGLGKEPFKIPHQSGTQPYQMHINWPGPTDTLTTFSLIDVLEERMLPSQLKDKIVIVSYGATTGGEQLRTPFDDQARVPAGYMHAAVADNLLNQNWLRLVPENTTLLIVLLSAPLFSSLLYRRKIWVQIALYASAAAGWVIVCLGFLAAASYLLPVVPPLAAILATGLSVTVLSWLQSNALWQVRSAFLNTMSHEIRTPLNAIVNLSDMLRETPLDDRQREFADILHNSSQTLLALINDVLDFSKIESGQFMLEDYPVVLHEAIERSIEMLAPHAAEKGLELVYALEPGTPPLIMSDPVRLQQILLNLLSNAVKFTEAGEVSVRVQAEVVTPPLERGVRRWLYSSNSTPSAQLAAPTLAIRFAVRDTGIGIPADRIGQLFKPFTQVSASTTRKYGGTGLGLSISRQLSERMGGDLWVRSYLGEGSTFYLTVRARLAMQAPLLPGYLAGLSGTRLLVIDDNETRRDRLIWTLTPLDIDLTLATTFTEALSVLSQAPAFDGIILDEAILAAHVALLSTDCANALDQLRQTAQHEPLPVILMSALKSSPSDFCGDTIILWKPIKQIALYQALRSIRPITPIPFSSSSSDAAEASIAAHPLGNPGDRLKILIAEDNPINQRVVLRLLELLGYQADVVDSGKAALAALEHHRYDVILMDMWMPELDGIETTRQIRQLNARKLNPLSTQQDVWIVAMTANAMARDRQRCYAAGMDDYLSKPLNREALNRALQRCPAMHSL